VKSARISLFYSLLELNKVFSWLITQRSPIAVGFMAYDRLIFGPFKGFLLDVGAECGLLPCAVAARVRLKLKLKLQKPKTTSHQRQQHNILWRRCQAALAFNVVVVDGAFRFVFVSAFKGGPWEKRGELKSRHGSREVVSWIFTFFSLWALSVPEVRL